MDSSSNRNSAYQQMYHSRMSETGLFSTPSTIPEQASTSYPRSTAAGTSRTTTPPQRAHYPVYGTTTTITSPAKPASYSSTTSTAAASSSTLTLSSTDPRTADLRTFANTFDKLTDERMDRQRYVMSGHKTEEVSKNALGAKVERALNRRMVGQDASFSTAHRSPRGNTQRSVAAALALEEKRALEVPAN